MFNKIKLQKILNSSSQIISQLFAIIILVKVFTCQILLTTARIIFSNELEFLFTKSLIVCNITVAQKSVEKPNALFPSGGKATVKKLFLFSISNAPFIPFFSFLLRRPKGTKAKSQIFVKCF